MNVQKVTYERAGFLKNLVADYWVGDKTSQYFSGFSAHMNIEEFDEQIKQRGNFPVDRKLLVQVLKEQYEKAGMTVPENVSALLKDNTFTVTTGHQLCLFTGPLYFIYKVVSTINLARQLAAKYPENNFVPVFWLASEDHDFEEVNHIHVNEQKLGWETDQSGAVGRMKLEGIEELLTELGRLANDSSLFGAFKNAYKSEYNLATATRKVVHELFPNSGLVVIDGDSVALKRVFADVAKADLEGTSKTAVDGAVNTLKEEGYKPQVNAREVNLFYLREGKRTRIERDDDGYELSDGSLKWSKEELYAELESTPNRFSPNVILRPAYQELVLPNLAYVGGPSEVAYWLQLPDLFKMLNIPFPAIMLRNSALLIGQDEVKEMEELGLNAELLFADEDAAIKEFIRQRSSEYSALLLDIENIQVHFNEVAEHVAEVAPGVKATAEIEAAKMRKGLKNLQKQIFRSEKRKHANEIERIVELRRKLFPGGLQERHDNILMHTHTVGENLIPALLNTFDPFSRAVYVLQANS